MPPRGILSAAAFAASLAAACLSPLSANELKTLLAGQRRWEARADYSVEMMSSCFCPPPSNEWVRVEVVGGQVHRAIILSTGEVIADQRLALWSTIEHLFTVILGANNGDDRVDVSFTLDSRLGYPTWVRWHARDGTFDSGGGKALRNVQPQ